MGQYLDVDLHGVLPEDEPVVARLLAAAQQARRRHLGLRIIHGRGEHVLADIAQAWLARQDLAFEEGVLNPGETRVSALALQRVRTL